jgi:hypothetical protein
MNRIERQNPGCCDLCGEEKPPDELEHDGRSFVTCKDAMECLKRVGYQETALVTAKKLEETSAQKWAEMKRRARG